MTRRRDLLLSRGAVAAMADAGACFAKTCQLTTDCASKWLIYAACYVVGVSAIVYVVVTLLAYVPLPDVTDQPAALDAFNRVDLMSLRYLLLEGQLFFPPPPPLAPPMPPPPPGGPPFAPLR